jgi:ribonuclease HI
MTWKSLQKSLPKALKKLLQTAKNLCLVFDPLAISKDLREEFPIFFHYGGNENLPKLNNSKRAKCLRDNHDMRSAGDALVIVEHNYTNHQQHKNCACRPCRDDGAADCGAPNKCLEEAIKFLNCLHEKWDPRIQVHQTIPDLSEEQSSDNTEALEEDEPCKGNLKLGVGRGN